MQSDLERGAAAIRRGLSVAGAEIPPTVAARAGRDVDDVMARFRTTGGHTVVALVGGTGSGKSTLFNQVTRSSFADVGHVRPSTRQASACVWGSRADDLLGYLGVHPRRRLFRDTMLERGPMQDLDGLVLLDLPDHDSVVEDHSDQVDRLLPIVDVLVWVVDPVKYADHILHEKYLRALRARADAIVVVLNQVDTLDMRGRAAVDADLRRLLTADGLGGVPVVHTSGLTGAGIDALVHVLRTAVAAETTAHRTARAGLATVAASLLTHLGRTEATIDNRIIDLTVTDLMHATGVGAVAESIEKATAGWRDVALATPQPPSRATVAAVGSTWAGRVKHALPPLWARAMDAALPSVETLLHVTAAAVESVPLPATRVDRAVRLGGGGVATAAIALAYVVAGVVLGWTPLWMAAPAVILLAVAGALLGAAHTVRAAEGARRAAGYARAVRAALTVAVENALVRPARSVLARHRDVRDILAEVRDQPLPTAHATERASTARAAS